MKETVMVLLERQIETIFIKEIAVDGTFKKIFAYKTTDFKDLCKSLNYQTREGLCFEEDLPKLKEHDFNVCKGYHLYNASIDTILKYEPLAYRIEKPYSFLVSQKELCPENSFDGEIAKFNYTHGYLLDSNGKAFTTNHSLEDFNLI